MDHARVCYYRDSIKIQRKNNCWKSKLVPVHVWYYRDRIWMQWDRRERSGSVVECLTRDRRAAGSSLTGVTVLCP